MLLNDIVFENQDQFKVVTVERKLDVAFIKVESQKNRVRCPCCGKTGASVHSSYIRTLKDLPAFGNKVYIRLKVRKFYCRHVACSKRIFVERFSDHFTPYKRMSDRLNSKLLNIALLTGGNAGAKLCRTLNIPVSGSTLLRLIHRQELQQPQAGEAIGIDDWAFKKGLNYGTAIVDLKANRIIDLLPDREASTVENWLKTNPSVRVVTRDRFARYAKGVTQGAPHAVQVADRWHLLKNMGDALQKLVERKRQQIKSAEQTCDPVIIENDPVEVIRNADSGPGSRRQRQLEQIKKLHSEGVPIRQIAKILEMSRVTVRKYLGLNEPPAKNAGRTNIARFNSYIQQRMEEHKAIEVIQIWKELKLMGYNGSRSAVYEYLKGYVKPQNRIRMPKLSSINWKPSRVSLLLYRNAEEMSSRDIELLNDLRNKCPDINIASILSHQFREMMENRQGHLLNQWVQEVLRSPLKELKGFAKGLMTDYEAVKNALTLSWSNGQVEGQINKLKTVKRQMYGRASFNLLRKRLIMSESLST